MQLFFMQLLLLSVEDQVNANAERKCLMCSVLFYGWPPFHESRFAIAVDL